MRHRSLSFLLGSISVGTLASVASLVLTTSCAESEAPVQEIVDAGVTDSTVLPPEEEHCEAGAFCAVELPPSPVSLNGIWGTSPDDVWIVGSPSTTIHWDGSGFSRIPIGQREVLSGVWGSGKDDVWTFGTSQTSWHRPGVGLDGGSWSPSSGETGTYEGVYSTPIMAMWGASASDVWAVGGSTTAATGATFPSVVHCDGWRDGEPNWQVSPTGRTTMDTTLLDGTVVEAGTPVVESVSFNAICGNEATGIWIVGGGGKTRYTSGWKDDAASWTPVNSHTARDLYAVWCSPDGVVWATGEAATMHRFTRGDNGAFVEAEVETPAPASLRAFWGFAADDLWAVGDRGTIVHWDGQRWTLVETPNEAIAEDLFAIWGSSTEDLWIAGRNVLVHKGSTILQGKVQ